MESETCTVFRRQKPFARLYGMSTLYLACGPLPRYPRTMSCWGVQVSPPRQSSEAGPEGILRILTGSRSALRRAVLYTLHGEFDTSQVSIRPSLCA